MVNFKELETLNRCLVDWNVNYSVYPYNGYTINEVLCQFFDAINKGIITINQYTNMVSALIDWVKKEGLTEEVNKALDKMIEDGTLDNIINKKLLKDILNLVDEYKTELSNNIESSKLELKNAIALANSHTEKKIDVKLNELGSDLNGKITNINKALAIQKGVIVYLNEYGEQAKAGTSEEDWTKAFKYVFDNVVNDSVATIIWNGRLKVKSTIELPKHVNISGIGLPWSGLTPTSDFNGEYVIVDKNTPTHNTIRNIYFDFAYNKKVKGLRVLNPYDYNEYAFLVGDGVGDTFISIGGDKISQSTHINNCVAYRENMGSNPIMVLNNCQEFYVVNNKLLFKAQSNIECLVCDGVTNTEFNHNSFAFTNATALNLVIQKHPKRLNGNVITSNLFEGIGDGGCVTINGSSVSDLEGSYNSIHDNSYFSSTPIINLGNIANTYISDPVKINHLGGDRRTYLFNRYNETSKTPYGSVEEWCDGAYKLTKSWFKILPTQNGEPSYLYMTDKGGKERMITISADGQLEIV